MTTPRIEKLLKKIEYNSHDFGEQGVFIRVEYAKNISTKAHQAGIDEAVEVIKSMKRDQDAPKEGDPHFTGCGGCGEAYPAICGCREVNQALDDTIKALQDNK